MKTSNSTSHEAELTLAQSIGKWLTAMLNNKTDPINKALSSKEKKLLRDVLDGTLRDRVIKKFNSVINQKALLTTLEKEQTQFVTSLKKASTVDALISHLVKAIGELLQSGVKKLEELARFCIDELYKLAELTIKLLRRLEISVLLPDWMVRRISGGESVSALSLFLALPASTLKSLLDAASQKNKNQ